MLKRSYDRKVSPSATAKKAKIGNSFGLPSGQAFSCPGATSVCESICYAGKLEKIFPAVRKNLTHNWDMLKNADLVTMVELIEAMLKEFIAEAEKHNAEKIFRIHWDGDFFSHDYALAWRIAINAFPDVQFWVYTRSFTDKLNVVPVLADAANLTIYLSVDADNILFVPPLLLEYPQLKVATLAKTAGEAKKMLPQRIVSCPENVGKLPLTYKGKGACAACLICVNGTQNVAFATSKKE